MSIYRYIKNRLASRANNNSDNAESAIWIDEPTVGRLWFLHRSYNNTIHQNNVFKQLFKIDFDWEGDVKMRLIEETGKEVPPVNQAL